MSKFVSFEENVVNTIQKIKSKKDEFQLIKHKKNKDCPGIPGYMIKGDRLYKCSNYIWDENDWLNYNYKMKKLTLEQKMNERKYYILAAWDQARIKKAPEYALI